MREDCQRYEPRGGPLVGKSEAEIAEALMEAYLRGFDDGVHETQQSFIQTQMLLMMPAGNA